jgi:hypothetical protein
MVPDGGMATAPGRGDPELDDPWPGSERGNATLGPTGLLPPFQGMGAVRSAWWAQPEDNASPRLAPLFGDALGLFSRPSGPAGPWGTLRVDQGGYLGVIVPRLGWMAGMCSPRRISHPDWCRRRTRDI